MWLVMVALAVAGCDVVFRVDPVPAADCQSWSTAVRVTADDLGFDDRDPAISVDGSYMVFTRRTGAEADLYIATHVGADFVDPQPFPYNSPVVEDSSAFFSATGDALYFAQDGMRMMSAITDGPTFAIPVPAAEFAGFGFLQRPRIAADGVQMFYFAMSPADLYLARRASLEAPWTGMPIAELASPQLDDGPTLSADERSLYFSSRRAASGARELWLAERPTPDQPFGAPTDLGTFGTLDPSGPDISRDGMTLVYFAYPTASADIYIQTRVCAN